MANTNLLAPVPGVTAFERQQLVTDVRFNTMVGEIAQKIIDESGKQLIGDLADLTTNNKSKVVAAVNEVNSAIGQKLDKSGGVVEGNLNVKSLGIGDSYKQKNYALTSTTGLKMVVLDMGATWVSGFLRLTCTTSNHAYSAGKIVKEIYISAEGTKIYSQNSKYTFAEGGLLEKISISDVYLENGKMKVKILLLDLGTSRLIVEGFGNMTSFELFVLSDPTPSIDTFITPSTAPVETIITSGFLSGWSGEIRFSKTVEGLVVMKIIQLTKTTDILFTNEVIYTAPSFAPRNNGLAMASGRTSVGAIVKGSAVEVILEEVSGRVIVRSVGNVTTDVRKIAGTQIIAG